MLPIYSFTDFPSEARVWTYLCKHPLTADQLAVISNELEVFTANWLAHGVGLRASYAILGNQYIVLIADETVAIASGCSIDSSVKFLKELSATYDLDLFNRMYVLVETENEIERVHYGDLANYPNAMYYDPTITTLEQLRNSWKKQTVPV